MKTVNQIKEQFLRIELATYNAPYVSDDDVKRRFDRLNKACNIYDRYIRNLELYLAPSSQQGFFKPAVFNRKMDVPVCREIYMKQ